MIAAVPKGVELGKQACESSRAFRTFVLRGEIETVPLAMIKKKGRVRKAHYCLTFTAPGGRCNFSAMLLRMPREQLA